MDTLLISYLKRREKYGEICNGVGCGYNQQQMYPV